MKEWQWIGVLAFWSVSRRKTLNTTLELLSPLSTDYMIDKYIYIEIRRTKFFSHAVKSLEMLVFLSSFLSELWAYLERMEVFRREKQVWT